MTIHLGFTGTQIGMTLWQAEVVQDYLRSLKDGIRTVDPTMRIFLHHGDCVGADADVHKICLKLGIPVIVHPPENPKKRAFCKDFFDTMPVHNYLVRNSHIISWAQILLIVPKGYKEDLRSGTWATARMAKRSNKTRIFFLPDGNAYTEYKT